MRPNEGGIPLWPAAVVGFLIVIALAVISPVLRLNAELLLVLLGSTLPAAGRLRRLRAVGGTARARCGHLRGGALPPPRPGQPGLAAVAHWCRRLVDTLAALILSKFVIVAVLSLAASALASGTQQGFASVLGGGALLLLATFTPFTLLRLLPAIEAGAVHQLEGAHTRVRQSLGSVPRSAASFAMSQLSAQPALAGRARNGHHVRVRGAGPSSATSARVQRAAAARTARPPSRRPVAKNAGSTRSAPKAAPVPLWRGNEPGARETRPTPGYSDRGVRPSGVRRRRKGRRKSPNGTDVAIMSWRATTWGR